MYSNLIQIVEFESFPFHAHVSTIEDCRLTFKLFVFTLCFLMFNMLIIETFLCSRDKRILKHTAKISKNINQLWFIHMLCSTDDTLGECTTKLHIKKSTSSKENHENGHLCKTKGCSLTFKLNATKGLV